MAPQKKRQKVSQGGRGISVTENETAKDSKTSTTSKPDAKHAKSTLFIRSLPPQTTNASLAEHFSQSFPLKHATAVVDKETHLCKGYGFVTFADHEDAARALEEFRGQDFSGNKLKIDFAERRNREGGGESEGTKPSQGTTTGNAPAQDTPRLSSKLIVRNLPWSVDTPEKLTKMFLSFGKINQVVLPKDNHGKLKGFGIVMLRGRKNAELAMERLNGKEMDGRSLAVDWAVDRDTWLQAQSAAKASEEDVAEQRIDSAQSDEEETEVSDQLDAGNGIELDDEDDEEDEDDEDEEDDEAEGDGNEDEDEETAEEESRPEVYDGTLFIKNLPFTTTDDDLQEHFEEFGPVRYARIVMDQSTERPRGTGFVCFKSAADAESCLREAPRTINPQLEKGKKQKAVMTGPSILQNELSDLSGRFTIDGRVLHVSRAVNRSEAHRLTEEGAVSRNKRDRDKRRLYLLGEGTIPSNSPLYQKLSPSEIAMREASAKQRRKLVDTNPALHLSLTRLSVRNIPRSITSKQLKDLAREAVVGFATDVKAGKRRPISKDELSRNAEEMMAAEKERKAKGKGVVKQAKIIFEGSEGGKVQEGAGRSRGYGFVEYHTHRSALMGLRWLNGHLIKYEAKENVKATVEQMKERKKRLIVEFAIENANVVKRRKDKEVQARELPKGKKAHDAGEDIQELDNTRWSNDGKGKKRKRSDSYTKEVGKRANSNSGSTKDAKKQLKPRTNGKPEMENSRENHQRIMIARKKQARRTERKKTKA